MFALKRNGTHAPQAEAVMTKTQVLSIIIPIYNEAGTIAELIRRVNAVDIEKELILVDDGSTDGTKEILNTWALSLPGNMKILYHPENRGKGAAIATGLSQATGDLVIIQDADLEYDPQDYPDLLAPFEDEAVQVVYGSRNLRKNPRSTASFYWGGRLLSWVTNWLYGSHITDEATCYKVIRTDLFKRLGVESTGFEFCPEITGKILRNDIHIHEVPISYHPRLWHEGKKIKWHDGVIAIWTLLKYRFAKKANL
ncbi:MAG: glycosyltransferase family 2 protein [Chloroflexota bacterium]